MDEPYRKKTLVIVAVICFLVSMQQDFDGLAVLIYAVGLFVTYCVGIYYGAHASLGMATFFGFMAKAPEFSITAVLLSLIITIPPILCGLIAFTKQSAMAFAFATGSMIVIISTIRTLLKRFREER